MTQSAAGWGIVLVIAASTATARAQSCGDCGCHLLQLPPDEAALAAHEATLDELHAMLARRIAAAIISYTFATAYASTRPHFVWPTDTIPVAGAVIAMARDNSPGTLLLFSAATAQALSILYAVIAGYEIADEQRSWELTVGASRNGAGVAAGTPGETSGQEHCCRQRRERTEPCAEGAKMSQQTIAQLLQTVRESIARAESSTTQPPDRVLQRVLAHLWSAYDELELLAAQRLRDAVPSVLVDG